MIRRHPLIAFFVLAYALSWSYWIPMAAAGMRTGPGSSASHLPGLFGPAIAALLVTAVTEGRAGVGRLFRRIVLVSRPRGRFLFYAFSPLLFLLLAFVIARVIGWTWPSAADFGTYSGLPAYPLLITFAFVLLFNGFGEETGWRGFALERLQHRLGAVRGTLALAGLWAGWHIPTFFVVETYRGMTVPVIIGGFGLGICAGSIVLARVTRQTGGSILAAALWHALYNMTSATAAATGVIAAVTTMCVIAWAMGLLAVDLRLRRRDSLVGVAR